MRNQDNAVFVLNGLYPGFNVAGRFSNARRRAIPLPHCRRYALTSPRPAPEPESEPEPAPFFNPYNIFAHSDYEYVYFSDARAICRVTKDSAAAKPVDVEAISCLNLHGNYIYYRDAATLCRVSKNSGEPFRYIIDKPVVTLYCKGGTLYFDGYMADVASDPDVLTLEETPKGSIAPDCRFYINESITLGSEVNVYNEAVIALISILLQGLVMHIFNIL